MSDAGQAMAGLARPMQHAVNNLVMVLQANMDSVLASLPPEDRASIRLARAAQAAKDMDALVRAFLRLGRPEENGPMDSGRFLASMLPVLALAAGKPVKVESISTATLVPRRPMMDLALLGAFNGARELPRTNPPLVTLDGTALLLNWPLPDGSRAALEEAQIGVEEGADSVRLLFPAAP
jgi:hypothetical protein